MGSEPWRSGVAGPVKGADGGGISPVALSSCQMGGGKLAVALLDPIV